MKIINLSIHLKNLEKLGKLSQKKIIKSKNWKKKKKATERINKAKSWFLEKTNRIGKFLLRLMKRKKRDIMNNQYQG